jgi:hypothetical protein
VNGQTQLFRKLRSEPDATALAGTERAVSPFFSPDGVWVGYLTTDGRVRKIPAAGGGSVTLTTDGNTIYNAAAWLDDGTIVYADRVNDLRRIPADGGTSTLIDRYADRRSIVAALSALPGGRGVLFTGCPGNCSIGSSVYARGLGPDTATLLVPNAAGAWHAPGGQLLYTDRAGGLYQAGFDLEQLRLTSGASPVIDGWSPRDYDVRVGERLVHARRRKPSGVGAGLGRARWHDRADRSYVGGPLRVPVAFPRWPGHRGEPPGSDNRSLDPALGRHPPEGDPGGDVQLAGLVGPGWQVARVHLHRRDGGGRQRPSDLQPARGPERAAGTPGTPSTAWEAELS